MKSLQKYITIYVKYENSDYWSFYSKYRAVIYIRACHFCRRN